MSNSLISNDKQYWVHTLERVLLQCKCALPAPRAPIESVDVSTIQSWIRRLLALERAYATTGSVASSLVDSLPPVTWVKLVRGRWCIAAVSNFMSSRLLLYDGLVGLNSGPKAEICLPGPVMDGVIEDTMSEINIAVSIGTV